MSWLQKDTLLLNSQVLCRGCSETLTLLLNSQVLCHGCSETLTVLLNSQVLCHGCRKTLTVLLNSQVLCHGCSETPCGLSEVKKMPGDLDQHPVDEQPRSVVSRLQKDTPCGLSEVKKMPGYLDQHARQVISLPFAIMMSVNVSPKIGHQRRRQSSVICYAIVSFELV